jgi:hypothetical protein
LMSDAGASVTVPMRAEVRPGSSSTIEPGGVTIPRPCPS